MIIELLLNLVYSLLNLLTSPINIPPLPEEVEFYFSYFIETLASGAGILANYTPLAYFLILFGIILVIDIAISLYHFVMWILRKIPMASIS